MTETTKRAAQLLAVNIDREVNDDGNLQYFVTPIYKCRGGYKSVPSDRGWETMDEALAEAQRLAR